jgi:peptide-methionine (S)-S-oxide reductase
VGTQYRSIILAGDKAQLEAAQESKDAYEKVLATHGFGGVTTEITERTDFYYAEAYHQQYLAKNPQGYCGLRGTGAVCPIALETR